MADKTQIWLSIELQKVKTEILKEIKKNSSGSDGELFAKELRYGYKQNQSIYDGLSAMIEALDKKVEALSNGVHTAEIDYDLLAEKVAEKLGGTDEETSYDLVIDDEGIKAIAKAVSEELRGACVSCECAPTPVEENAEEVEEETPVEEEISVTAEDHFVDDGHGGLIDTDTGLVVRLKRSFTAKMKQSEEKVKEYYSALKNALTSYKKVKSNVSWHADRYNCGRETIAKMNICGKTLCFYLALDPNDPAYKTTVYHQKDVSDKKAYESTPFMVKVKSDVGVKKAIRLIDSLAQKYGVEKRTNFEEVNYVDEFYYESTEELLGDGFIKATKEKRVNLKF